MEEDQRHLIQTLIPARSFSESHFVDGDRMSIFPRRYHLLMSIIRARLPSSPQREHLRALIRPALQTGRLRFQNVSLIRVYRFLARRRFRRRRDLHLTAKWAKSPDALRPRVIVSLYCTPDMSFLKFAIREMESFFFTGLGSHRDKPETPQCPNLKGDNREVQKREKNGSFGHTTDISHC